MAVSVTSSAVFVAVVDRKRCIARACSRDRGGANHGQRAAARHRFAGRDPDDPGGPEALRKTRWVIDQHHCRSRQVPDALRAFQNDRKAMLEEM